MLLRRLPALVRRRLYPRQSPLDTLVSQHRVWPSDLNLGGHMDNVRYLSLMDLARSEFFARAGIGRLIVTERMAVPVAASHVRYRRELLLRDRFELRTRIVYWDAKWFFIEQTLVRDAVVVTEGLFKCIFLGRDGYLPPATVLAKVGATALQPPIPAAVAAWFAAEARQREVTETELRLSA